MGRKRSGIKTKERNRLKEFAKLKGRQRTLKSDEAGETYLGDKSNTISFGPYSRSSDESQGETIPFLTRIDKNVIQDTSSGRPGFVINKLEVQELSLGSAGSQSTTILNSSYGSTSTTVTPDSNKNGNVFIRSSSVEVGNIGDSQNISQIRFAAIVSSLVVGVFLGSLDGTILSTLLDYIASEFEALPYISWIAASYLLSACIFQPLYGKLSDIFGRKAILLFSNLMFGLGCLVCGTAPTVWWLLAGRFVAGIGGGGLTSMPSIIISDIVPLRSRASYQDLFNICYVLGITLGGSMGGWLAEYGGWRLVFLLQVVAALISGCFIQAFLILPKVHHGNGIALANKESLKTKLYMMDWLGTFCLVIFLASLTLTCSLVDLNFNFLLLLILLMFVSGYYFVYHELNIAADPILSVHLLTDRNVLASSLANFFCMLNDVLTIFYVPMYFASVLYMGPKEIGKRTIISFLGTSIGSFGTGYYIKRRGKYRTFICLACIIGILGQLQIALIKPSISTWRQYLLLLIPILYTTTVRTSLLISLIAAVPYKNQTAAASISYTFRSTGAILGASLGGGIFRSSLKSLLNTNIMPLESEIHPKSQLLHIIDKATHSTDWVHRESPEYAIPILISCYHYVCKRIFTFSVVCVLFTSISCYFLKEYPVHASQPQEYISQDSMDTYNDQTPK
ncbi:Vba4p Ecym_4298 [Eremothecium cymbalariae DBVPG|uniref:Major facilitator superfamily (MFS) profile domain-containing protein n=1 Tax=Eremothecium cymbalariae (strain CBS 270.75 / DBVPG 7215 / KCTC 17166 / NRRL Y-17582) TaxID=931890 RepID=G8JTK8_ERECY|nr:hypothetical protein Ecym_4298 [Eremothecium cymbalariae DBVPG\